MIFGCLGLSEKNANPYIEAISGFYFDKRRIKRHQIKKSSFAKVGSCQLNKN